ncbi:MAG: DUF1223 domain-containing protein [Sphingomonadaceae bacterium]|nr:DUF1223 domain-containing protein [Sphingomonadaceae bacterium]
MYRMLAAVLLATTAGCGAAAAADPAHPVVVELFQSQGCSSCPPANASLNAIADRADVLALSFAVTYWDQLGWKDIFGKPAYTGRQWDYAHAGGRSNVATPQMIVDGRVVINGGNLQEDVAAIRQAARGASGPAIAAAGGKVTIGRAPSRSPATVWLVRYDPRTLNVPIRAGENGGRTLPHKNIVRSIDALGAWNGAPATFAIGASPNPVYRTAILVQQGKGGAIIAAAKI